MPFISDNIRTIIWIFTGLSLVLLLIIAILIRSKIDYWIRRMIPQLNEKPPTPSTGKNIILGALFWLFLTTTILGAAFARPIANPDSVEPFQNGFALPTPVASFPDTGDPPIRLNVTFPPDLNPCNMDALTLIPDEVDPVNLPPVYPIDAWFERHEFVNRAYARITVTNTASQDEIQLNNRIITRVIRSEEITGTHNAAYTICNEHSYKQFTPIDIQPGGQITGNEISQAGLINIKPWNRQVFEIELSSLEVGIYEVEVGVEYMVGDEAVQVWSPNTLLLFTPESFQRWSAGVVTYWGECNFEAGEYFCEELEYEEPILIAEEPFESDEGSPGNEEDSPAGCRPAPPSRLSVGMEASVSYRLSLRLRVREAPGLSSNVITAISRGTQLTIAEGPTCRDGYLWWRIQMDNGVSGWSAEGEPRLYYLSP